VIYDNNLVDSKEMANILRVPLSWIYGKTYQGQEAIPYIKLGKYLRFEPNEVVDFFRNKEKTRNTRRASV